MSPNSKSVRRCEAEHVAHRLFCCARCRRQVRICRNCDHGNRYCSSECATAVRRERMREAGRRYQQSGPGQIRHQARQREYRQRQEQGTGLAPGGTAEQKKPSSLQLWGGSRVEVVPELGILLPNTISATQRTGSKKDTCYFCGLECSEFSRRNYLKSRDRRRRLRPVFHARRRPQLR